MPRPHDRPATAAALVNALVVWLLPLALIGILAAVVPDYSNGGTRVVGVDPDRAAVLSRKLQFIVAYVSALAPFAMAAAWRTFVHATRWLDTGAQGGRGILEGAVCGFAGAVLVLLPGILTRPTQAPPYVLAYGGLAAGIGLVFGLILWTTATITLRLYARVRLTPAPREM
jgi:hypothetical protein